MITTLLPSAKKTFARLRLNLLFRHLKDHAIIPESQYVFHASRGTVEKISAAKQVQRKFQVQTLQYNGIQKPILL